MGAHKPLTGAQRVARRRAALRAQGLRPRTFWLPDMSTPEFRHKARQIVDALDQWHAAHPEEIGWIEAMADEGLPDAPAPAWREP